MSKIQIVRNKKIKTSQFYIYLPRAECELAGFIGADEVDVRCIAPGVIQITGMTVRREGLLRGNGSRPTEQLNEDVH